MRYPSISPDGTKIAFASDHSGNFDIYLMSAEGRTPKRLTTNSTKEILTSFTTDGKSAIFTAVLADSYKNPMYSKGCLTEPYSVSTNGGRTIQKLTTPTEDAHYNKEITQIICTD